MWPQAIYRLASVIIRLWVLWVKEEEVKDSTKTKVICRCEVDSKGKSLFTL